MRDWGLGFRFWGVGFRVCEFRTAFGFGVQGLSAVLVASRLVRPQGG